MPLRVMSRHRVTSASCPLFPSKRTFISAVCTSAKCQKQTSDLRAGCNLAIPYRAFPCLSFRGQVGQHLSIPIRISEQTCWVTSAWSAAMPLFQTKSTDEEAEIIICRGPTQCESPKEWPCEICIHISANEIWLVEELVFDPRSQRRSMILVSSALRGMWLKLTEI
jgi:hypothetical protein